MEDNIFHRTLTRHLPNTLLINKGQVTLTLPQQLHLAILAQQFSYPVRTCRGMKLQVSDQPQNKLHTTLIPVITHITNVLQ